MTRRKSRKGSRRKRTYSVLPAIAENAAAEAIGPVERAVRLGTIRRTRQRVLLASFLDRSRTHLVTAELLHAETCGRGFNISLATCYNTLNRFAACGIVGRISVEGRKCYFNTDASRRAYLYFEDTDELYDAPEEWIPVDEWARRLGGIATDRIHVVIRVSGAGWREAVASARNLGLPAQ